jgi:hypothetical protein
MYTSLHNQMFYDVYSMHGEEANVVSAVLRTAAALDTSPPTSVREARDKLVAILQGPKGKTSASEKVDAALSRLIR